MHPKSDPPLWGCALDALRCARRRVAESDWRSDERMQLVAVGGHRVRVLDTGGDQPAVVLAADAPVVLEHYVPLVELLATQRRVVATVPSPSCTSYVPAPTGPSRPSE